MNQNGFLNLAALPLALALFILGASFIIFAARRRLHAQRQILNQQSTFLGSCIAALPPLVLMIGAVLLWIRPYLNGKEITVPLGGADILVAVDVSRSMEAQDTSPDRIAAAKRKIRDLSQLLSRMSATHRVGLIPFAGAAVLYCPLTSDRTTLEAFVQGLSTELMTSEGSAIESALTRAGEAFERSGAERRLVLLLSDGEDANFSAERAQQVIKRFNLQVFAIGFGTEQGATIPEPYGGTVRDSSGAIVVSKLNQGNLISVSGVNYRNHTLDDSDLSPLVSALAQQSSGTTDTETQRQEKIFQAIELPPTIAAALLVGMILLALFGRVQYLLPLLLLWLPTTARSDSAPDPASEPQELSASANLPTSAREALANQDFEAVTKLLSNARTAAELRARGTAEYRLKRYNEALRSFTDADSAAKAKSSPDQVIEQFYNRFNAGNSLFQLGQYQLAIDAYDKALALLPDEPRALHNRELAKQKLAERSSSSSSSDSSSSTSSSGSSSSSDSAGSSSSQSSEGSSSSESSDGWPNGSSGDSSSSTSSSGSSDSAGSDSKPASSESNSSQSTDATGSDSSSSVSSGKNGDGSQSNSSGEAESASSTPGSTDAGQGSSLSASDEQLSEAMAVLDALPDAPLIPRRENSRGPRTRGGQRW